MRTLAELQAWRDKATEILGDPAATCGCAFFRYVRSRRDPVDLSFSDEGGDLLLGFRCPLFGVANRDLKRRPKNVAAG